MAQKKKIESITTPKGVAKYPWIGKADTRFNSEGVYSVRLIVPNNDVKDLCAKLDEMAQAAFDKAVEEAKTPQAKKAVQKNEPYAPEFDDQGNETGNTEFKFKSNATAKVDGKVLEFKPKVFDAKGKPVEPIPAIYGGSELRVNFSPVPYFNAASKSAGVSLRLNAVQVLKLVTGGGNARSYGFDTEEDGFEFADGTSAGPQEEGSGDAPASGAEF